MGVSEIVAALLLLSITVAAFGVYYTYYVSGLSSSGKSVDKGKNEYDHANRKLKKNVSYSVQGDTVTLYLYNYGLQPITLSPPQVAFLVAGSQQQAQAFALTDATSGSSIGTIKTQELGKLTLTFGAVPSTFYVDIIDSIQKRFEFQLTS